MHQTLFLFIFNNLDRCQLYSVCYLYTLIAKTFQPPSENFARCTNIRRESEGVTLGRLGDDFRITLDGVER